MHATALVAAVLLALSLAPARPDPVRVEPVPPDRAESAAPSFDRLSSALDKLDATTPGSPTPASVNDGTSSAFAVSGTGSIEVSAAADSRDANLIPWASAVVTEPLPQIAPSHIEVRTIGIDAPILSVGVDASTGQMAVAEDVATVGWYQFGPRPGELGSAVLAAHVDVAGAGPGVFFHLEQLQGGDQVTIAFDDGSRRDFIVASNERMAKEALDLNDIFRRTGSPVVRLVTCGGGFNQTERAYNDNVVVTLEPVLPNPGDGS